MEHKYNISTLTPLTIEECVLTNGGSEEGDFWHDLAVGIGRFCGWVDGVLDRIGDNVQRFFDKVEAEWENLTN